MFFKVSKLKKKLQHEQKINEKKSKYICSLENTIKLHEETREEIQKLIKNLEEQKNHYEGRAVRAESKLARIKNNLLAIEDKKIAYEAIVNIMFGSGKHAK